jgi:hypothetical protein
VHEHIRGRVALLLKYLQSRRTKFRAAINAIIVAGIIDPALEPIFVGSFALR